MTTPMMKCGHAANAVTGPGLPVCIICFPDPKASEVDYQATYFEGRQAKCSDCGRIAPSSPDLAFYKYLGPGSPQRTCKHCNFVHEGACPTHYKTITDYYAAKVIPGSEKWAGESFEPKEYEFDEYYCGCRGWD